VLLRDDAKEAAGLWKHRVLPVAGHITGLI
jgi:hypothetical protein